MQQKKIIQTFLHIFPKSFWVETSKNCSKSCILDISFTRYFIGCLLQLYHYQTGLLTIFHVSILYTGILKSIIKQYAGIAECHAFTECYDATQREATRRSGAAWRPVDCLYSSVEDTSFITTLFNLRVVLCNH